jgi:hypothetical protein
MNRSNRNGNGNGNERDTDPDGTMPAPKDPKGKLGRQLAELELAIYRVGELLHGLQQTASMLRLAQATEEHRLNTVQDVAEVHGLALEDHERRLRELETLPAAE